MSCLRLKVFVDIGFYVHFFSFFAEQSFKMEVQNKIIFVFHFFAHTFIRFSSIIPARRNSVLSLTQIPPHLKKYYFSEPIMFPKQNRCDDAPVFSSLIRIHKEIILYLYKLQLYRCLFIQIKYQMEGQNNHTKEHVQEDHLCPVCYCVFYEPAQLTKCKHIFCDSCLKQLPDNRCPLCRTDFDDIQRVAMPEFWLELQGLYPLSISEHKKSINNRILARFLVGNSTEFLQTAEANKYRWTLFVRPAPGEKPLSETISQIDLKLHPTFAPSVITYNIVGDQTVQLPRLGWGTFRIQIQITWKDIYAEKHSTLVHDLQFIPLKQRIVHTALNIKAQ